MSYTYLRAGDWLPAAGVLQKLLNRTGAALTPDGIFGRNTKTAVEQLQQPRGLVKDGIVGRNTWPRLVYRETRLRLLPVVARLRPIFVPYGCIQFMHCSTGRGPGGRQLLLSRIADTLGVLASAAVRTQYPGEIGTFRFEGPTYTAFPGGGTLRSWCQRLPDFAPTSVP